MTSTKISGPEVEAAVQRYWQVLVAKSAGEMERFYTHDASVFNPFASRTEPGRLSAARKERQFFTAKTSLRVEYTGPIEVQLLADNIAVASYTFRWFATSMVEPALGKTFDKAVRDGRGTQVFVRESDGGLRIVHEHLSDIWRGSSELPK
jgi:ketosteroid isomerase-like protein